MRRYHLFSKFSDFGENNKRRGTSAQVIPRRHRGEISCLRSNVEEHINPKRTLSYASVNSGGTAIPNSGGTAIPNSGGTAIPIFIHTHLNRYPAPRCGGKTSQLQIHYPNTDRSVADT